MAGTGKVSGKQEQFAQALLANHSVAAAAKLCNIGERTAYRWHKDETVQARLKELRKDVYNQAIAGMLDLIGGAIGELRSTIHDGHEGHGVKLKAVSLILDNLHRHMVAAEIDERLSAIEQHLAEHE